VHALLTQDLSVPGGLRTGGVGVTGTACVAPASRVEIASLLDGILGGINGFKERAEKALGCRVLLSCLQPFAYGNRRTSRLMANAVLVAHGLPPAVAAQHRRAGLQERARSSCSTSRAP
jgi:Fic family protein